MAVLSCKEELKPVEVPAYVLSKEKFSDVLCDFTLAETATNINVKSVSIEKFDSVYRFNPLKEHGLTKEQFDTTLYFYTRNPSLFKEVYELCLEKLSKLEEERKKQTQIKPN